MIEETIIRLRSFLPDERIFVCTNPSQGAKIVEIVPGFSADQLIIEPFGRDTAACVGLAAARIHALDPHALMCLLPADHVITPVESFASSISRALTLAEETEGFVTIGIKPTFPATSYGYIKRGEALGEGAYGVDQFCEKPELATAEEFLASGDYYWNGGMFIWKTAVILSAIETHLPDLAAGLKTIMADPENDELLAQVYGGLPRISIDFGVMEHVDAIYTVEADFSWDDVGSWSAVRPYYSQDEQHNAVAKENATCIDSSDNIVNVPATKQVVLIDMHNTVVVDTDDALLICPVESDQKVKRALDALDAAGRSDIL
jgi:mannose-1-phosphate guanylyltransferase